MCPQAHRFSEVVKLEVPLTVNVKSFIDRRLGSVTFFKQSMVLAKRDRGRFRKEYIALAWGNKTLFPKEYSDSKKGEKKVESFVNPIFVFISVQDSTF